MNIQVTDVKVQGRIREDIGEEDIQWIMKSFLALGQLQPIVLSEQDGNYFLIAGQRRLIAATRLFNSTQAIKGLELGQVKCEIIGQLSPHVQLMAEYDENDKRKDFSFIEKAKFIRKFHETMQGQAKSVGSNWTAELTAASLRLSPASISHYLRVEEAIKSDPSVAKADTLNAAVKRMKVTEQLNARQLEVKDNASEAVTRAEQIITKGDALELIKGVNSSSVDFINFDPPWGDDSGHKSNDNHEGFDDSTEVSDRIINGLLPELFRVLKDNRFLIFWYRTWAYGDMVARLEGAGFSLKFARTPCLWYKPDKVSDQNRFPEKQLLDSYETFLIARKGEPVFNEKGRQNVFSFSRVPLAALLHPTEKPLDLCDALVKLCTVPGETVFDPTAGSMATLVSAIRCDRKTRGFELSETYYSRGITRIAEYLKLSGRV